MFALPNSKRVRRDELSSPRSSRSPSPVQSTTAADTYTSLLRNAYSSLDETYAPPDLQSAEQSNKPDASLEHTQEDDAEHEFEFRLFHKPAPKKALDVAGVPQEGGGISPRSSKTTTQRGGNSDVQKLKLRLRSPTPLGAAGAGGGGLIVPFRGWEYYFTEPELVIQAFGGDGKDKDSQIASSKRKSGRNYDYVDAAVSGEDVVRNAREQGWPGTHLPWRIIHLKTSSSSYSSKQSPASTTFTTSITDPTSGTEKKKKKKKKKKKPGKKRRIILRKRLSATKAASEAEREKRARRNREKKLKRRKREKERKAGDGDGNGNDAESE